MAADVGPGVKISGVTPGGPADDAGLRIGDHILQIDDTTVATRRKAPNSSPATNRARRWKFSPSEALVGGSRFPTRLGDSDQIRRTIPDGANRDPHTRCEFRWRPDEPAWQ